MLATATVEMFATMHVTKIVVRCAHCFNTLANEYPQLGGRINVDRAEELVATGSNRIATTCPFC